MPNLPADPIFISYSRRDEEVMREIAFFLRDQGFKVWVDNEKLIPGTPAWEESIEKAIKDALVVIVILSPDSKNSEWVRREITYSDQFQKRVIPVLVKGTEETSLPIRLVTRQFVDYRQNEESGLKALSAALTFHIEKKQTQEMERPSKHPVQLDGPTSVPVHTRAAKSTSFLNPGILSAGVLMTICILGLGALWIAYRLFSFPLPVTGPATIEVTSLSSLPIQTPTGLLSNTVLPTTAVPAGTSYAASENDKVSEFLRDVQIVHADTFDNPAVAGWEFEIGEIRDGTLEAIGKENMDAMFRTRTFVEGEGILIDFSYTENSTFIAFVNSGSYNTDSYRRFGLYVENGLPLTDIYEGGEYIWQEFSGNLSATANETYTLLLAILPDGELLEAVWDTANPDDALEYRNSFGDSWAGLSWIFAIQIDTGTMTFDNFKEITFSGAK